MMTREQHRAAMHALSIAHITSPSENRMRARTAREQHAAAMEALPIFLDRLVPSPVIAIVVSVTAVLIFGE